MQVLNNCSAGHKFLILLSSNRDINPVLHPPDIQVDDINPPIRKHKPIPP